MELKESVQSLIHFKNNVDREWKRLVETNSIDALCELQFDLAIFNAKVAYLMEEQLSWPSLEKEQG